MKKAAVRFGELLCVVLLCLFLVFVTGGEDTYSDVPFAEVEKAVTSVAELDTLEKKEINKIKDTFSFDMTDVADVIYYASDDIMDVRELLLIRLREGTDSQALIALITKRADDKQALFEGYAPVQGAMLKNRILTERKGYILYAVGDSFETAESAFKDIIK